MYLDIGQSASKDPQQHFITFDDQDIYRRGVGRGEGELLCLKVIDGQ